MYFNLLYTSSNKYRIQAQLARKLALLRIREKETRFLLSSKSRNNLLNNYMWKTDSRLWMEMTLILNFLNNNSPNSNSDSYQCVDLMSMRTL